MTNIITNVVLVVTNGGVVSASVCDWDTQVHFFSNGLCSGFALSLGLAVMWAVIKGVRGAGWFWEKD